MRILLLGKNGQVGWELGRALAPLGEVMAVDTPEIDFLDLKALREFTLEAKPDLIVHDAELFSFTRQSQDGQVEIASP
jgi:dTDP-4-dehydrorhamnose reductase